MATVQSVNLKVNGDGDTLTLHRVISMPPDGSCLFHAIAFSVYGSIDINQTNGVRAAIVEYVYENWQDFSLYTSDVNGEPFNSADEYKCNMLRASSYGAAAEIKAAGCLYTVRFEVYVRDSGTLAAVFGIEQYPVKRLLFSGNLSSGHYDVCVPEEEQDLASPSSSSSNIQEKKQNTHDSARIGRPKRNKGGRPKTSEKSRAEQLRDSQKKYKKSHPEAQRKAVAKYTAAHPEVHRSAVARYSANHPEVRNNIVQNYRSNKKLSFTAEIEVVNKLSDKIKNRIEAEKIVKWVLHHRKNLLGKYCKLHELLQKQIKISIEKFQSLSPGTSVKEKIIALAGESKHRRTQEPYFYESSYKTLNSDYLIAVNTEGQAHVFDICQDGNTKSAYWTCDPKICLLDEPELQNLNSSFHLITSMLAYDFYIFVMQNNSTFISTLKVLNDIKAHFPKIRTVVRELYQLGYYCKSINKIDDDLYKANVENLKELGDSTSVMSANYETEVAEINLSEDIIIEKYKVAFNNLKKRSVDTPKHHCISCHRLLCLRDMSALNKLRKPIESDVWQQLLLFNKTHAISPSAYICRLCLEKIRSNDLPANCILNDLYYDKIPQEIKKLNNFEKLLIQRAKSFQVVTSMIPVGNKNVPNRQQIKKVKGRTFHLPLPLETTLKKIPKPEDPLNLNQELYILVRSTPTKSKILWQDLVDVNRVYNALNILKQNNVHYSSINLPQHSNSLLDDLNQDLRYETEKESSETSENGNEENLGALLTQVIEGKEREDIYDDYTIYPLHEKKTNATATALYQMLKVNAAPLDYCNKNIDTLCFPDIYTSGRYGQFHPRKKTITSAEFIKSRLTSVDSRFRLNLQYLFYLLNDANLRQLSAGIFYKLNVTNQKEKITAKKYLEMIAKDELEGDLMAIFSRLRNTEQFWKKPRNDVVCMTLHYGPATWFLTISPSEWTWTDLGEYLKEINGPDAKNKSTSELVAMDPVAASRFIDVQFKATLDFITSSDAPIGVIEHYFWRREYQARGLQHFHLMLWVKDAPILEESTIEEVGSFISKYVTCAIPDKNVSPQLHHRVMNYQTHKHNSYCLRKKKTSSGFKTVCRFGFPRQVTDTLKIKNVVSSIAARKTLTSNRLYDLPRNEESRYINDYNPAILLAWNGNMDLQYVGEKTAVLNYYITKYTTKSEKSHTIDTFDDINSSKSLSSRLYNVGLRALNNRECGALEASDTLLGISLYGTDPKTTIRWLDVNIYRNRRVKPKKEIDQLECDSTNIFFESWVDSYYPQRPETLENMNLYDFARWFDISSTAPSPTSRAEIYKLSSNKFLKKRDRPYLINHYSYDVNKFPEKYYFALLLMFYPWRDLAALKSGQSTYTEAFNVLKNQIKDGINYGDMQTAFINNIEKAFEMIQKKVDEIEENRQEDNEEDSGIENPLNFMPIEAQNAMEDFRNVNALSDDELHNMIIGLNIDQKRIFDRITNTLTEKTSTLRLFVSGTGGTGKSYLIHTIKNWVRKHLNKLVAVAAPTGIAAFNVNGLTVHRLLQLPVEHGNCPKYTPLSDEVLQVLRSDLCNVILLIIDEVSMISNVTLMYIHLRLTEIYDSSEVEDGWFGKIHIVLFGDLLQLPPVRQLSPFEDMKSSDVEKLLGSLSAINLWKKLFSYDELTVNMRQKNDHLFGEMLNRLRLGVITRQDVNDLFSRLIKLNSDKQNERLNEIIHYFSTLPDNTVCLFATRNMCHQFNNAMLNSIQQPEIQLNAIDEIDCPRYLSKRAREALKKNEDDSSLTAGLENIISVKIGARVMLRRNVDVSIGLVNGSIGTIQKIIWDIDDNTKARKIQIHFNHDLTYELERVKTKFQILNNAYVHREQFPLCLAYAITIHKSQGLSLDSALLDIGSSIFSRGQAYVALSRVKTIGGVHLINLDPTQIKAQESSIAEYNRLKTLFRPDLEQLSINRKRLKKIKDREWAIRRNVSSVQETIHNENSKIPLKRKKKDTM